MFVFQEEECTLTLQFIFYGSNFILTIRTRSQLSFQGPNNGSNQNQKNCDGEVEVGEKNPA